MRNKKVDLIDYENSSTLEQCNNNNTIDGKNSNEFGIFIYSIKFDDENSISSNTNDHECFEKDNALFNDEKNCKFDNVDEENINDIDSIDRMKHDVVGELKRNKNFDIIDMLFEKKKDYGKNNVIILPIKSW